jgi:hypothetical protein
LSQGNRKYKAGDQRDKLQEFDDVNLQDVETHDLPHKRLQDIQKLQVTIFVSFVLDYRILTAYPLL